MADRYFGVKYQVVDDLREELDPKLLDEEYMKSIKPFLAAVFNGRTDTKDLIKEVEPHEVNPRCLKSVN